MSRASLYDQTLGTNLKNFVPFCSCLHLEFSSSILIVMEIRRFIDRKFRRELTKEEVQDELAKLGAAVSSAVEEQVRAIGGVSEDSEIQWALEGTLGTFRFLGENLIPGKLTFRQLTRSLERAFSPSAVGGILSAETAEEVSDAINRADANVQDFMIAYEMVDYDRFRAQEDELYEILNKKYPVPDPPVDLDLDL